MVRDSASVPQHGPKLNFASMAFSESVSTSRETVSHAGTPDVIWLSVFFFPQGRARGVLASHPQKKDHQASSLAETIPGRRLASRETAAGS